jgi:uncharacterized protein (TIRG00374 family)
VSLPDGAQTPPVRDAHEVTDAVVIPTAVDPVPVHAGSRDRWLKWVRRFFTVAVLALIVVAALTHRKDLDQAVQQLDNIRWGWLGIAVAFEVASLIAFARLQRWLLRAAGVHLRMREMVEITLAGNALAMSLPGGAAWAAAWVYAQLHRRGAKRDVAVWVVLVAGAIAAFALFLLMVAGAIIAGGRGPVASLRLAGLALLGIPVLVAAIALAAHRSPAVRRALTRAGYAICHVPGGRRVRDALAHLIDSMQVVKPTPLTWLEALGLALVNWLGAWACLVACIIAVHGRVPWRGVLVAYAVGQVAASLPITPGGLGVVEGSITGLLVAYGMPTKTALAGVLLFRVVSFWALVPVGWIAWITINLASRHRPNRFRHPWRVHPRGAPAKGAPVQTVGATKPLPDRMFPPPPCKGCEPHEEAETREPDAARSDEVKTT